MPYLNDRVLDNGLWVFRNESTRLDICTDEPSTYTEATSTYSSGRSLWLRRVGRTPVEYTGEQIQVDGPGRMHCDITMDEPGRWYYRWEFSGNVEEAVEGWLVIERSRVR